MVKGIDRFRDYFRDFTDEYVLIGGALFLISNSVKNGGQIKELFTSKRRQRKIPTASSFVTLQNTLLLSILLLLQDDHIRNIVFRVMIRDLQERAVRDHLIQGLLHLVPQLCIAKFESDAKLL